MRDSKSKKWRPLASKTYTDEEELKKLLVESPEILPTEDLAVSFVVAVPEFGLGSGAADMVMFSIEGDIAIVECKLDKNPEIKRKVIGQIFEYASYLWGRSYEQVDSYVREKQGKSLAELVKDKAEGDWDEENFRDRVKSSLEKGNFFLIVAVDKINEELKRTVQYFNQCLNSGYSFYALEMRHFKGENSEILIPHLHPESLPPSVSVLSITKEEFLKKCAEPGRRLFKRLEELANEKGHELKPKTQAFSYYAFSKGSKFYLLTLWPNSITILKGNIHKGDKMSPEAALKFRDKIVHIRNLKDKYDAQDLLFISAFRELLDSIAQTGKLLSKHPCKKCLMCLYVTQMRLRSSKKRLRIFG